MYTLHIDISMFTYIIFIYFTCLQKSSNFRKLSVDILYLVIIKYRKNIIKSYPIV